MNIVNYINVKLSQIIGLSLVLFISLILVYIVLKKRSRELYADIALFFVICSFLFLLLIGALKLYYVYNFGIVLKGSEKYMDYFQINKE